MISAVLEIVSVISGLMGLFAAAKGSTKTQKALLRGNQHDRVIDVMAWVDKKVLRTTP